jgi:hypothetical protein
VKTETALHKQGQTVWKQSFGVTDQQYNAIVEAHTAQLQSPSISYQFPPRGGGNFPPTSANCVTFPFDALGIPRSTFNPTGYVSKDLTALQDAGAQPREP